MKKYYVCVYFYEILKSKQIDVSQLTQHIFRHRLHDNIFINAEVNCNVTKLKITIFEVAI